MNYITIPQMSLMATTVNITWWKKLSASSWESACKQTDKAGLVPIHILNTIIYSADSKCYQTSTCRSERFLHCVLSFTPNGPFSANRPKREDPPGPPCNHSNNGEEDEPTWNNEKQVNISHKIIIRESVQRLWHLLVIMGTWFAFIIFPCVSSIQHWCVPRSGYPRFPKNCVLSVTAR